MRFGDKLFHKVNGKSFMHVNGIARGMPSISCLCAHQTSITTRSVFDKLACSQLCSILSHAPSVILSTFQVIFQKNTQLYPTANEKNKFFAVHFPAAFKLHTIFHFALFCAHIQIVWSIPWGMRLFKLQKGKKCHIWMSTKIHLNRFFLYFLLSGSWKFSIRRWSLTAYSCSSHLFIHPYALRIFVLGSHISSVSGVCV